MRRRSLLVGLAALAGTAGLIAPSSAATATTPTSQATVTVVHGIPGANGFPVDIYAGGSKILSSIPFGWVITFKVPAGDIPLAIRAAGSPASSEPALAGTVTFKAGVHTNVLANLTADGKPTVTVFDNDTTPTAKGSARVTVAHAAAAPAVDVVANNALRIVKAAPNGAQAKLEVPAARYQLKLTLPGQDAGVYYTAYTVKEGVNTVFFAIGDIAGKFTVVPLQIPVGTK